MNSPTAIARRLVHRFAPMLGLLLLVVVFTSGTHNHVDGRQHVCAVCTVGHSPAVAENLTTPTAAPATPARRLIARTPDAPRQARRETASSRAPPLA